MSVVVERVHELIAPILADLGLDLYDLDHAGGVLRVVVDRPGGVDMTAIADATTIDEAGEAAATGFARVPWQALVAGDGEARLRELGVTIRVLQRPDGTLPASEDEPDTLAVVARSY